MGRDYVTLRGERHGNEVVFVESSVARMNLKSIIARVTRRSAPRVWSPARRQGRPGPTALRSRRSRCRSTADPAHRHSRRRRLDREYCWVFFSLALGGLKPGKHVVVSRAIDVKGRMSRPKRTTKSTLKKPTGKPTSKFPASSS